MAKEAARVRRRERKNIVSGVAHVNASFNNTMITITDAQGAEPFADEVGVARRIEDVELFAEPLGVEQRAVHRDLVLLFAGVVVGRGRAGSDVAHAADAPGAGKHGFGEHCLAGGRVSQDGEAAQIGGSVLFHVEPWC